MLIKIVIGIILILIIYFVILNVLLKSAKKDKKDDPQQNKIKPTVNKALTTIKVKANKINNDNLANITKHDIFENEKTIQPEIENSDDDIQHEDLTQIDVESTIDDESIIIELENNDTLDDLAEMADLMKNMAMCEPNENDTGEYKDDEFEDINDELIADFINSDFLNNINENN